MTSVALVGTLPLESAIHLAVPTTARQNKTVHLPLLVRARLQRSQRPVLQLDIRPPLGGTNLGRQMPESVVLEELEALGIRVQGVMQLRSGRRTRSTPHSTFRGVGG